MKLTKELRQEYVDLFNNTEDPADIETVRKITLNKSKYIDIENLTQTPWYVIAILHEYKVLPQDMEEFSSWEEAVVVALTDIKEHFDIEAWYIPEICHVLTHENSSLLYDAICLIKQLVPELESTKIENKQVESNQDKPTNSSKLGKRILDCLF